MLGDKDLTNMLAQVVISTPLMLVNWRKSTNFWPTFDQDIFLVKVQSVDFDAIQTKNDGPF